MIWIGDLVDDLIGDLVDDLVDDFWLTIGLFEFYLRARLCWQWWWWGDALASIMVSVIV